MRLPTSQQRIALLGRTGSGKTVGAVWHLSRQNYQQMPWVVLDYKGDELIARLPAQEIKNFKVPKDPGIYVLRPNAGDDQDDERVENFLWGVKKQGRTGVYCDEGYMLPFNGKSQAWRAIQTQGRSTHNPTITLLQRPVWADRFILSEADFYQVFHLNDERDRKTIKSFLPTKVDMNKKIPDFHSYYYDVGLNNLVIMKPVPTGDQVVSTFVAPKKKGLLFMG